MKYLKLTLCLSAFMGVSFVASAADGPTEKQIESRFESIDTNTDSAIDFEEYKVFREAAAAKKKSKNKNKSKGKGKNKDKAIAKQFQKAAGDDALISQEELGVMMSKAKKYRK